MGRENVMERIITLIERRVAEGEAIEHHTSLRDIWLRLESVQVIEFIVELETYYEITLPDELLGYMDNSLLTVQGLAETIERKAAAPLTLLPRKEGLNSGR
jgi:acyl carrier protein